MPRGDTVAVSCIIKLHDSYDETLFAVFGCYTFRYMYDLFGRQVRFCHAILG